MNLTHLAIPDLRLRDRGFCWSESCCPIRVFTAVPRAPSIIPSMPPVIAPSIPARMAAPRAIKG